jgi:hypothetical protein
VTRTSVTEPHQSFDHQRLWADLLWSPTLAFNLFGDLAAGLALAVIVVWTALALGAGAWRTITRPA